RNPPARWCARSSTQKLVGIGSPVSTFPQRIGLLTRYFNETGQETVVEPIRVVSPTSSRVQRPEQPGADHRFGTMPAASGLLEATGGFGRSRQARPSCFMNVTRSYMRFSSTICSLSHSTTV